MKTLLFSVLLLIGMAAYASMIPEDLPEHTPVLEWNKIESNLQEPTGSYLFQLCTVSASGYLLIDGGKVKVTATVEGPCNASLATRLRACIARLRASV